MITEIITIYVIIDDLLKATGHREDRRVQMSDAEVITAGLVAARFFSGNHSQACTDLKEHGWMPQMLEVSRFSRRWQRLFGSLLALFDALGTVFKARNVSQTY